MDDLDMRSVIYVPIRSQHDGAIRGALACILAGSDPRVKYTAEDVRFAEEVAVRAGLAFDNARAYEREKRIAVTLQGASLPKMLPTIDHLYLSADYRPGKSEATIGGDWYDAFALDDGRVAITVGDVLGNGLAAAVTMGRLRQSMRAIATLLAEPNAMLDAADRTVKTESDETYATALAGVFDPRTHQFTFASAGHPSPVLRHPDGRIEEFNAPGMMLGLRRGTSLQTITIDLKPGSTLVFFTDGLTEATRDIEEGHRRLHAAMSDDGVASADNPAHALVEHVLQGRPATDDIAVLVAEVGPSKRFDERLRTAAMVAADREQVTIAKAAT
jgi:serine phosphatase RsbU (regulator of sigma subunit)